MMHQSPVGTIFIFQYSPNADIFPFYSRQVWPLKATKVYFYRLQLLGGLSPELTGGGGSADRDRVAGERKCVILQRHVTTNEVMGGTIFLVEFLHSASYIYMETKERFSIIFLAADACTDTGHT